MGITDCFATNVTRKDTPTLVIQPKNKSLVKFHLNKTFSYLSSFLFWSALIGTTYSKIYISTLRLPNALQAALLDINKSTLFGRLFINPPVSAATA